MVGSVIEGKDEDFVSGVWPALVAGDRGIFLGFGSFFLVGVVGFSVVLDENRCGRVVVVVRGGASGVPYGVFFTIVVQFTLLLNLQQEKGVQKNEKNEEE